MSLYGGNLLMQSVDEDTVFEDCMMESVIMEAKLPADMKMQVEDYRDGSKFKSKFESIIKWMKENYSEKKASKKISSFIYYSGYFGLIGNVFGDKNNTKYPANAVSLIVKYTNQYCTDKHKNAIKKDMEKTLAAFEKNYIEPKNKMSAIQDKFYKEIKANVNKL